MLINGLLAVLRIQGATKASHSSGRAIRIDKVDRKVRNAQEHGKQDSADCLTTAADVHSKSGMGYTFAGCRLGILMSYAKCLGEECTIVARIRETAYRRAVARLFSFMS